jgi:hypothetical protein
MKKILKAGYLIVLISTTTLAKGQDKESTFDKTAFYKAMQQDKIELVNDQLNLLKTSGVKDKEAFEGALTMKKAGFWGSAGKKLNLFKAGHKKLEAAIHADTANTEFRFLRLMIQEHAPGMLGYKNQIKKDSEYIRKSYKTLSEAVRQAILEYNKKSKVLKLQDS